MGFFLLKVNDISVLCDVCINTRLICFNINPRDSSDS